MTTKDEDNNVYMLLLEKANGVIEIATEPSTTDSPKKLVVAKGSNWVYLVRIGQGLMDEGLINGYQLIMAAAPPVSKTV